MGVIRPPWISQEWFQQCPFNYCDHFGDRVILAQLCKICRDEIVRNMEYEKRGQDPNTMENVIRDVGESLAEAMTMVHQWAEEMDIDLDNIPDDYHQPPPTDNFPIYQMVNQYGDVIQKLIQDLEFLPPATDPELVEKCLDALAHSRYFISAKISRALSSKWREMQDDDYDIQDSKTSAFFAFIALERNSRALVALAKHGPLKHLADKFLHYAKLNIDLAEQIRDEFFPDEKLVYEELGYQEY